MSGDAAVTQEWLASMLRNYLEQDTALVEGKAVVITMPNDPNAILVMQRGGDHLMVQVNKVDVTIYG